MDDEIRRIREKRAEELKKAMQDGPAPAIVHVDQAHFREFVSSHPYVVLDFWAEWCGPCRRVSGSIEDLAKEFSGKVTFGKCNTDENQSLAMQFNITAIPTIMFFSHGQMVERIIGAYPKEAIREKILKRFGLG